MTTTHDLNKACNKCTKQSEYDTRLHCLKDAQDELYDIFGVLNIPATEQDILAKTINKEDICVDSFKMRLSKKIISNKK